MSAKYLTYSEDKKLKTAVRLTFIVIIIGLILVGSGIAYIVWGIPHGTETEIPYTPKNSDSIHGKFENYEYTVKKELDTDGNYLRYVILNRYNGKEKEIKIPSEINKIPVKTVGNACFMNNEYIESLSTMANLKEIDNYAFYGCKNLSSIHFVNNSVTKIGEHAFERCKALTSVDFPSDIEVIDFGAFQNCTVLEEITFSGSPVVSIDAYAFCNTALISVKLPSFTKSVGKYAFANCKNLTSLVIPDRADYNEDVTSKTSGYSYYRTTERTTSEKIYTTTHTYTNTTTFEISDNTNNTDESTDTTTTYRPWLFRMFDRLTD